MNPDDVLVSDCDMPDILDGVALVQRVDCLRVTLTLGTAVVRYDIAGDRRLNNARLLRVLNSQSFRLSASCVHRTLPQ